MMIGISSLESDPGDADWKFKREDDVGYTDWRFM